MKRLVAEPAESRWRTDVPLRDIEWLAEYCCQKLDDPAQRELAHELCALVVSRFCQPSTSQRNYDRDDQRRQATVAEQSLPDLLKALLASGDENLVRLIEFVETNPLEFSFDYGQVPALKAVVPWTSKRFATVPRPIIDWLESVR